MSKKIGISRMDQRSRIAKARSIAMLASAAASVFAAHPAFATALYWDSNGTGTTGAGATPTGTWGTSTFWNTSSSGDSGTLTSATRSSDDLHFSAGTDAVNPFIVTVNGTQLANSITFEEGTVTLSGGTAITISNGGNITNSSGNLATFSTAISQGTGNFSILGNSSIAFQTIAGSSPFNVTVGASGSSTAYTGTVTLAGSTDNGYLTLIVDSGTVDLDKTTAGGTHSANLLTINGGTVQIDGQPSSGTVDYQIHSTLTVNGGSLDLNGIANEQVGGISGSGGNITNTAIGTTATLAIAGGGSYSGLITDGAGKVALLIPSGGNPTLSGNNTFSGGLVVSPGTLTMSGNNSFGSGNITVSGGSLSLTGSNSGSGLITLAGGNLTTGVQNSSSGGLNSFTGNITIKAGAFVSNAATYTNPLGSGSITLGDSGNTGLAASLNLNPSGGTATLSNPIAVVGNGTNTINGSNYTAVFTGNITLSSNVILEAAQINNNGTGSTADYYGNIAGTGNITLQNRWNGGGLNVGNTNAISINPIGSITNNGNGTGGVTITGTIGSNVAGVTQNSPTSALTLSASNSFTGGLTIQAGTVVLSNGGNNTVGNGTITIGNSANTGQAATLNTTYGLSSTTATFSNPITVTGNGTDTLEVTNYNSTYTGNISLSDDLSIISSNNNGSTLTAAGNITGTGNLTLQVMGTNTGSAVKLQGASISNVGAITNSGTGVGAATISGNIGGNVTGVIQNSATTTLTLSGNNTYSSSTTVSAGTLKAGVASVAGVSGAFGNNSALTLLNVAGAGIDITGFNTQIGSITGGGTTGGNVTLGAARLTTGGDNTSPAAYAGIISGTGGVTKIGTGTQIVSGANVYTGSTTISGGMLTAGVASVANTSGAFGNNSALILGNATSTGIDITGFNTQIGSITGGGTNGGNVTLGAATLTTGGDNTSPTAYAGVIAGTGGITKIGTGTQTFSGPNSYSGATTVSGGTLTAGVASVAGVSGAFGNNSALILANVASTGINITGFNTQIGSITGGGTTGGNVTLGAATLTVGGDGTSPAAYAGAIAGTGGVTKIGNGTQIFSGSSSYSGVTTISTGILQLGNATALGTSAVSLLSGATLDLNGNAIANNFTSSVTRGTLTNTGGAASGNGSIINNGNFTVDGTGNITLNGGVGGSGTGFIKNGNNTLTLGGSGDNGFLAVTLNAGTVILGKASSSSPSIHALGVTSTINGGTLQLGGSGGDQIYSGASILVLGGTFDVNSLSEGVGGLQIGNGTSNGSVTGTTGVLTVTSTINAQSGSATAILSGGVGLTKTTNATVTLAGPSTYSLTTTISAGTLRANNGAANGSATGSGSITVAKGATLGGNGGVTGAVTLTAGTVKAVAGSTLADGGTITAGASAATAGTLTTGNQTWGAATNLAAKLVSITGAGNTTATAGTDNDYISAGAITFAGTTALPFDVQLLSGGSSAANFHAGGALNYTIQLASYSGITGVGTFNHAADGAITPLATSGSGTGAGTVTIASNNAGLFVLDTSSFTTANPGSSSGQFELELVANGTLGAGYLDAVYYSSAPEPGTAILLIGGAFPMLIARRRRRGGIPK